MYRVIAVVGGALLLAACSTFNLDFMKPGPVMDTVRFESNPPGADVKTSNGQTCRTPCALALPTEAPITVTYTLNGYLPATDTLDPVDVAGSPPRLQPNPSSVELEAAPPAPKPMKPVKKPAPKKKTAAKKPAAKPKPVAAPTSAAPQAQPASPWPTPPPAPAQQR